MHSGGLLSRHYLFKYKISSFVRDDRKSHLKMTSTDERWEGYITYDVPYRKTYDTKNTEHIEDTSTEFIHDLLPYKLSAICRKKLR